MDGMSCVRKVCFAHFRLLRLTVDNNLLLKRTFYHEAAVCQRARPERKAATREKAPGNEAEFRTFEIKGLHAEKRMQRAQRKHKEVAPPRYVQMPTDQDWTNVWPAASTFKWSVVPFPVRQGFVETTTENDGVVPSKYANAELMKIPNFLHLTPAHVKKHCAALKHLCTDWPEGLETDEACRKHFPIEVQSSDYVFAGPSIRDPRSRTITVKFSLSDLKLDYHARDKFIRLVGKCYKPDTDEVVFVSEKCPLKKQNFEYAIYLLTAVYTESWKREAWEDEKTEEDMERYFWENSKSKKTLIHLLQAIKGLDMENPNPEERRLQHLPEDTSEASLLEVKEVQEYRDAVSDMINTGESQELLHKYGQAVRTLLGIRGDLEETNTAS